MAAIRMGNPYFFIFSSLLTGSLVTARILPQLNNSKEDPRLSRSKAVAANQGIGMNVAAVSQGKAKNGYKNSENNFLRLDDLAKIMRGLKITQMIIYAGGVGDQVENDSNPEKKTSQCTIESNSASTKLYFCKLNDNFQI